MTELPRPGELLIGITATDVVCIRAVGEAASEFYVLIPGLHDPVVREPDPLSRQAAASLIASDLYRDARWRYCDCVPGPNLGATVAGMVDAVDAIRAEILASR